MFGDEAFIIRPPQPRIFITSIKGWMNRHLRTFARKTFLHRAKKKGRQLVYFDVFKQIYLFRSQLEATFAWFLLELKKTVSYILAICNDFWSIWWPNNWPFSISSYLLIDISIWLVSLMDSFCSLPGEVLLWDNRKQISLLSHGIGKHS